MVNWFTIIMVFFVVWWVVLFIVLPFGATPPEEVEKGHSTGAPAVTNLGIKAIVTTVLALVVTVIFFFSTSGILVSS